MSTKSQLFSTNNNPSKPATFLLQFLFQKAQTTRPKQSKSTQLKSITRHTLLNEKHHTFPQFFPIYFSISQTIGKITKRGNCLHKKHAQHPTMHPLKSI